MSGGEIYGNTADTDQGKGGGVCVAVNGTFTMTGGYIRDNESKHEGGGVCIYGSSSGYGAARIREGSIGVSGHGNRAIRGGGVFLGKYGRLELGYEERDDAYPLIRYNTASGSGGGLVIHDDEEADAAKAEAVFYHGTISGNDGAGKGGGILLVSGTLDMRGGLVTGNTAEAGPGIMVESYTKANKFIMSGFARALNDANPVFLDNGEGGTKTITLGGAFDGNLSGGIAKIALADYELETSLILEGTPALVAGYYDKFEIISPSGRRIDESGRLR
jgi:hypothetical protein